jgi:aryl-alcohol dehydrogenase-like predicted oxidoreductase
MCRDFGLGTCPWGWLAAGKYSGKHSDGDAKRLSDSRKVELTDEDKRIANLLKQIASDLYVSPTQVALAFIRCNPMTTSPIMGVRSVDQLEELIMGLDVHVEDEYLETLLQASHKKFLYPYDKLGGTSYHFVEPIKAAGTII